MTLGILKSIQTKYNLYKLKTNARTLQQQTILTVKYKKYRNLLNRIIRAAKTHHWHNVFSECKYDMKQTWKNINSILSKTPNKNNLPNSFLHEGHNNRCRTYFKCFQ